MKNLLMGGMLGFVVLLGGCGSSGGGASSTVPNTFLYSQDTNCVEYSINSTTGALAQVGSTALACPSAVDAVHDHMYVGTNPGGISSTYNVYSVTAATGAAGSQTGSFTIPTNQYIAGLDPMGRYLYAVNGGSVGPTGVYAINASTGVATLDSSPSLGYDFQPTFDATGNFVYSPGSKNVYAYSITANPGTLTAIGPPLGSIFLDGDPLLLDPENKFLYGYYVNTQTCAVTVQAFAINASNGTLSSGPESSVVIEAPTITSTGFVYGQNCDDQYITAATVNSSTGVWTSFPSPVYTPPSGNYIYDVVVDPNGQFLWAWVGPNTAGSSDSIVSFTINSSTGALTQTGSLQLSGSTYQLGGTLIKWQ